MLTTVAEAKDAQKSIQGAAIRTPLVRLNVLENETECGAAVFLKLENVQPIGAFKIRGAANAIAHIPSEELSKGIFTASAGNMAQGVAWRARELGVKATIIVPETAPEAKLSAIARLGASVVKVPFEVWWNTFQTRSYPGLEGAFVHAFDDPHVMAGNGTIALEILEDLPDVEAVILPWGGGGLACGVGAIIKALRPDCKVFAAEVASGAPLAASLEAGSPQIVDYQPSFVDGIGSKTVFPQMLERAKLVIDGVLVAELDQVQKAVRLLAERNRVIAEGAGAASVACALFHLPPGISKVACVISGGNIDLSKLSAILSSPP